MIVAVPKEIAPGERRVALVPAECAKFIKKGLEVVVESGAGLNAGYSDEDYEAKGAKTESSRDALFATADIVVKVQAPRLGSDGSEDEASRLKSSSTLISFLFPASEPDLVRKLKEQKITAFAMELMPRITRAQSMDALSSMSNIAGYKAVLHAANLLPRYFPLLMTAAGTITPARVLILGAGVAGLQAIATARRLGAVVEAYDVRAVVKEQVESLGARFVELEVETGEAQDQGGYAKEQSEETQRKIRDLLTKHVSKSDVVITTALVPGKKAPVLLTADMISGMKRGSIIIDLAAEQGGNCEGTVAGEVVDVGGARIFGPTNLASEVAADASDLYARNISTFLDHLLTDEGALEFDLEDELTSGPMVTHQGNIVHQPTKAALEGQTETNGD